MKKSLLFCICVLFIAIASCVKPGKGGKAILSVHVFEDVCTGQPDTVVHTVVPQAVVYIKYGGTAVNTDVSSYDDAQVCDFGGKTVFENLKRGDYYLYGVSKDGLQTGGTHFEIRNRIGEREVVICTGEYE